MPRNWLTLLPLLVSGMHVELTPRLRAVFPLYFGEQPMRQEDIARRFGVTRSAITHRIRAIYRIYEERGIQLQRPGATLRTVTAQTLSGYWDRNTHEYMPTQN